MLCVHITNNINSDFRKYMINLPNSVNDDFNQRQATLLGQPTNQLTVHSMAAALMNLTCLDT